MGNGTSGRGNGRTLFLHDGGGRYRRQLGAATAEGDFGITSCRAPVGFGVRLTINFFGPVPFVFDFGWPIAKDDDTRVFNFSMGASF